MAIQTHTMRRWREFARQVHPGKLPTVLVTLDPKLEEMIEGPLFVLRVYYRGHSSSVDGLIERAARAHHMGSGFNFVKGERDIDYHYATKQSAKAAQARVRALRIRTLRASVKNYVY